MNPFFESYSAKDELVFIQQARDGSKTALERLVKLHERFIYNIALRVVHNPEDAADLTQEVLIKMVTKLGQFKGNSSFRTWLYRITINHFIKTRKRGSETDALSFEELGEYLDTAYLSEDMTREEQQVHSHLIDITRNKCISAMLLCLDRQQRVIFILGAIFNLKSTIAAPALGITPENFRKQLSRARADLFQFMDNKCGLINPDNPCRCHKKLMGFIKEGKVEPTKKTFIKATVETIQSISPHINDELDKVLESKHLDLFRTLPYEDYDASNEFIKSLLFNKEIKRMFHLN
jgi:RNA polymerase sigma factor (sigma-70 family)